MIITNEKNLAECILLNMISLASILQKDFENNLLENCNSILRIHVDNTRCIRPWFHIINSYFVIGEIFLFAFLTFEIIDMI